MNNSLAAWKELRPSRAPLSGCYVNAHQRNKCGAFSHSDETPWENLTGNSIKIHSTVNTYRMLIGPKSLEISSTICTQTPALIDYTKKHHIESHMAARLTFQNPNGGTDGGTKTIGHKKAP